MSSYSDYSKDNKKAPKKVHKDLYGWYYFVNTVQIDNAVFDVLANVRLAKDGQYIYSFSVQF